MISNCEDIYGRVKQHKFGEPSSLSYRQKLDQLEDAISTELRRIGMCCKSAVHLGYSGGVDSSLALTILLEQGFKVVAHTMGASLSHPDVVYAARYAAELPSDQLEHKIHIQKATGRDLRESNRILGAADLLPDNYYMLMKCVKDFTSKLVCCDVIDELCGGYYAHASAVDKLSALEEHKDKLIERHLSRLDKISTESGVEVFLAYSSADFFAASSLFSVEELFAEGRKTPVYNLARKHDVPDFILKRRKYGLVSALDEVSVA